MQNAFQAEGDAAFAETTKLLESWGGVQNHETVECLTALEHLEIQAGTHRNAVPFTGHLASVEHKVRGALYKGEICELIGPANTGKTRFALAAAAAVLVSDRHARVAWFC